MNVPRLVLLLMLWAVPTPAMASSNIGPDFTQLSAQVLPTTVKIEVERGPLIAAGIQQLARDRLIPAPRADRESVKTSSGSGVIFDAKGLVITNHHVINGATHIRVTLHDQRQYTATVVASDPRTDLAVLTIDGDGPFTAASFTAGGSVEVGQWVVAVGHPFNFPFTVTAGIVSALGRRGLARNEVQDYIQTDVAVNPGSSGGPLFNIHGEVVGINTAIFSPDKENMASAGISFAIPAQMAHRVAQKLARGEPIAFAGIGVRTQDAPPSREEPRQGARITKIIAGGPAERAGMRRGDVIYAIDGQPVASSEDLKGMVEARDVGQTLRVTFGRGTSDKVVQIKTQDTAQLGARQRVKTGKEKTWAGMSMVNPSPDRLLNRGVALPDRITGGALVTAIAPGSPAATAGILPGDVLLQIHEMPIKTVDELLKTVENRRVVLISFWRGENRYLAAVANPVGPG